MNSGADNKEPKSTDDVQDEEEEHVVSKEAPSAGERNTEEPMNMATDDNDNGEPNGEESVSPPDDDLPQVGPPSLKTYLSPSTLPDSKRPNILLIITDQERSHKHWPEGWAETNLPCFYNCLVGCCRNCTHPKASAERSSVMFTKAFTATTECSPSRASLLTSSYPTEHGVDTTPGSLDPLTDYSLEHHSDRVNNIQIRPNLLRLLSNPIRSKEDETVQLEGYDVAWKGKWHLTPPVRSPINPRNEDPSILMWYGATNLWNPPDAGHSLCRSSTLGGGWRYNHDGRFLRGENDKFSVIAKQQDLMLEKESMALRGPVGNNASNHDDIDPRVVPCSSSDDSSDASSFMDDEKESILDFLAKHAAKTNNENTQPFFLVTSLVNPHDVWASACFSNLTDEEFNKETGYHPKDFENLPIELPPSHKDDLSTKPSIQSVLNTSSVFGSLPTSNPADDSNSETRQSDALRYVRFYAHLHKQVDAEISSLLQAIETNGQMDNTIIIRMADHGEMALSHGLREKRMNCYDETMGIPLVINYPSGYFDQHVSEVAATVAQQSSTRIVANLVSSIDILPTITEIAGVDVSQFHYRGRSLVPFFRNDCNIKQNEEEFLFTFDEPLAPRGIPGYVRCLRTSKHKYAVYFTEDGSCFEYEMYDLVDDPLEMRNLTPPGFEPDQRWRDFHDKLTNLMYNRGAMPKFFDWFTKSVPKVWTHKTLFGSLDYA